MKNEPPLRRPPRAILDTELDRILARAAFTWPKKDNEALPRRLKSAHDDAAMVLPARRTLLP